MNHTMSLNAELLKELSGIADDEGCVRKVLAYVRKVAAQRRREEEREVCAVAEEGAEYRPLTKAELVADLNEMCEEVKRIRAGKLKGRPAEELLNEL